MGLVALTVIAMAVLRWPLFWTFAQRGPARLRADLEKDRPMTTAAPAIVALSSWDWLQLFLYYLSLSLLAVGGAISTAPDMHRFSGGRNAWLTDPQFNASIAIAQAAPGPNVLFIALLGWNIGINAGGPGRGRLGAGPLGILVCMVGVMLPSSLLTWQATRWGTAIANRRSVRLQAGHGSGGHWFAAGHGMGADTRPWPEPPIGRCGPSRPPPPCWCGAPLHLLWMLGPAP